MAICRWTISIPHRRFLALDCQCGPWDSISLRCGSGALLVTLGPQDVLLIEGQSVEHLPAVPVAAVDASGAGDAFIGSLAVFLVEGLPLREAARRANIAAALSVTRPGTRASFPRRIEIETYPSLSGG
jgi:sugar/nucleoside kinase (ribokinase family)